MLMHSFVRGLLCSLLLVAAATATPAIGQVPSPRDVLGHQPGESGWLAEWSEIVTYMERLDQASARVQVTRIGTTAMGRPMVMAIITSEANHARLREIMVGQAALADPRGVPAAEIDRLIATQPAVAFIGASLHGNEIMATQMSMELAHDLATDPELGRALEDVVVLLVPGMNPDGLDITRGWWMRTRGTEYAGSPMPWMYHHYVGHDNNRDFFMVTQPETKAVTRVLYEEWFPEVVYDVHQMGNRGARFFIPPFADPLNPNLDPLLVRETNLVGVQMALDLTDAGKTGISHRETFDLWWHGGGRTVPARHNMVGILSEAASSSYGDPVDQTEEELRQPEVGSMFPEPWEPGVWTPRDIVEYELIAAKSLIRLLDRQRETFVGNMVELARRQIAAGNSGDPFAYVLPVDQLDPGSAAELANVLMRGGVEVHRATAPLRAGGRTYPAGSWVVLMGQPFRAHAKDLLEPQRYPDRRIYPGGPPDPPYDLAGWTLPMQMGVEAVPVSEPFSTAALAPVDSAAAPAGEVSGARRGAAAALDPKLNNTHRAIHEVLNAGGTLTISEVPVSGGGERWPAGTPVVSGVADLDARLARWASDWGVNAVVMPDAPAGTTVDRLRVGLYKPWTASMDEGWTRWLFEQWEVPFDTVKDARIRRGDLTRDFDVIVVPDVSYRQIMQGLDPERSPAEYAGGLGEQGAAALRAFVEGGGTLVLLDSSSDFAIEELGVPVRNFTAAQDEDDPDQWYAPGSLLRVRWNADHPVAAGMPEESAVFYARSPVFEVEPGASGVTVLARYPESDLLMSGYAQGEEAIAGKAAAVVAEVGAGHVVMFGFRPQHRAQPHETFKPLFNSLYLR
jgi:hypothetical protein